MGTLETWTVTLRIPRMREANIIILKTPSLS